MNEAKKQGQFRKTIVESSDGSVRAHDKTGALSFPWFMGVVFSFVINPTNYPLSDLQGFYK